jgi:hypothetical protein
LRYPARGRSPAADGAARMNDAWSDAETDNPLLAGDRNFCEVEKWTKDTRRSTGCSTPAII